MVYLVYYLGLIDCSVLINEGVNFSSMTTVIFGLYCWLYKIILKHIKGSLNISAHLSVTIILVGPNLVRTFLIIFFLILIIVRTLENNYFLVRTKLGYFILCNILESILLRKVASFLKWIIIFYRKLCINETTDD